MNFEKKNIISNSETETFDLGKKVGEAITPSAVICLDGELGVGKTVFAKGLAKGLGIDEPINSPTFTIIHEYKSGRLPFYHFDVYRIEDESEMDELGFDEYIYGDGVCLIEWSSKIEGLIPKTAVKVSIKKVYQKGEDYREIEIENLDI